MWPAARRLVEYFEAVADDIGLSRPGVQIAELGAGTGWLSVCVAIVLAQAALLFFLLALVLALEQRFDDKSTPPENYTPAPCKHNR